jgi:fructose-1,6-bisphosphatase II / sedoheptulose-1,7-bisphosphatase
MAEDGGFLSVPDVYMEKIAIGSGFPDGIIDLDLEPEQNLQNLADARGCAVSDLLVCLLDRPRHNKLIGKIRDIGARIRLILDGDVSGIIQAAESDSGVDVYMGIGGAQQGILAAAALRSVNGQMQGRLVVRNDDERSAIAAAGIEDPERKYSVSEMASGNVTFAATGVTYGSMLDGVKKTPRGAITKSLVMRSLSGTIRYIEARHKFGKWTGDA